MRTQASLVAIEEIRRIDGSLIIKEKAVVDAGEEFILLKL